VIKLITAESLDNTLLVELEDQLVGLDTNRDGLVDNSSLHGSEVVGSDVGISSVSLDGLGGGIRAVLGDSSIRIVSFSFDTALSSVDEGIRRKATVATLISSDTINELLFRERDELLVVDEVETFKSTSSRESPAGTAASLVLDVSDGTLSSPINGDGKVLKGLEFSSLGVLVGVLVGHKTSVQSTEFFSSQVSEVVQSEGNIALLLVELEDFKIVVGEDLESDFVFVFSGISLLVSGLPLSEKVLDELLLKGSSKSSDEEEGNEK